MRPGPGVVLSSLKLLIRLARHSKGTAILILECPGLVHTIIKEFLPPRLPPNFSTSCLYGAPVWLACKLCRILSAWDRRLAAALVDQFHLEQSLLAYLTLDPSQGWKF